MEDSKWILEKFKHAPQKTEFPLREKMGRHKIGFDVTHIETKEGATGSYRCSLHCDAHNTINFNVDLSVGKSNLLTAKLSPLTSTKMATKPEVQETEKAIEEALETVNEWGVEGDHLILRGPEAEFNFKPKLDTD